MNDAVIPSMMYVLVRGTMPNMDGNGSGLPAPAPRSYSPHVKGWAVALALMFQSYRKAADYLRSALGEENAPDHSSIHHWAGKMAPEAVNNLRRERTQALEDSWYDAEGEAVDYMVDRLHDGSVSGKEAAIIAGISADKRIRLEEIRARSGPAGVAGVLAAMQQMQRRTLPDGTIEESETKLIATEGDMG